MAEKQGFPTDLTAKEAFGRLCSQYGLDDSDSARYDSMETLQDKYGLDPPISVRSMTYTYDNELETFLGKFGFTQDEIDEGISAEACFKQLREDYKIDESLSDKEARKIFIIRNEIATNGFTRYQPIKIASDISEETIVFVEESGIKGAEISSETERYYPYKNVAATFWAIWAPFGKRGGVLCRQAGLQRVRPGGKGRHRSGHGGEAPRYGGNQKDPGQQQRRIRENPG